MKLYIAIVSCNWLLEVHGLELERFDAFNKIYTDMLNGQYLCSFCRRNTFNHDGSQQIMKQPCSHHLFLVDLCRVCLVNLTKSHWEIALRTKNQNLCCKLAHKRIKFLQEQSVKWLILYYSNYANTQVEKHGNPFYGYILYYVPSN